MAPLTWENGQSGKRSVHIDGLTVDVKGKLYVESTDRWHPIGLMELKPTGCQFYLTIKNGQLGGMELGIRKNPGNISLVRQRFGIRSLRHSTYVWSSSPDARRKRKQ